jgi:hypothetical protein
MGMDKKAVGKKSGRRRENQIFAKRCAIKLAMRRKRGSDKIKQHSNCILAICINREPPSYLVAFADKRAHLAGASNEM